MKLRLSYGVMAVVLVGALVIGTRADSGAGTPAERAHDLAQTIRCPTCRSQSAADSDTVAAKAVRAEIDRRVADGQSDAQIRDYFASRYGEEILLTPTASGVTGLVWILPVAALVIAVAGLVVKFGRWRRWTA